MPRKADTPPLLQGLPAVAGPGARVLVLGSMPGEASLQAARYYAHPRNHFWPIMGELFGAGPGLDYDARLARLMESGVAVWDVIGACRRRGSLDSAIDPTSLVVNDFATLFAAQPTLRKVFFNGAFADAAFRRHALPKLGARVDDLHLQRLPSTSPANASQSFATKLQAWSALRG